MTTSTRWAQHRSSPPTRFQVAPPAPLARELKRPPQHSPPRTPSTSRRHPRDYTPLYPAQLRSSLPSIPSLHWSPPWELNPTIPGKPGALPHADGVKLCLPRCRPDPRTMTDSTPFMHHYLTLPTAKVNDPNRRLMHHATCLTYIFSHNSRFIFRNI
jgi:hypothetical protein